MAWCLATEIVQVRVADLANSPAMRCDPRLDLNNFELQISYPRINHQFPNPLPGDENGYLADPDCAAASIPCAELPL